jgi:hypothetical protein
MANGSLLENPPRSHTKGHEGFFFFFVSLRVTSWRIFEGTGEAQLRSVRRPGRGFFSAMRTTHGY